MAELLAIEKKIETIQVSIEDLKANDYNPNVLTEEQFRELVEEVKHLGRVPKPLVVRANGQGFEIVDGEHNWKAAKEAGLREVTCEMIEADEFEAMRQTYKRNQHGQHDPVKQGRMFAKMIEQRSLSNRQLAEEIDISEGTIRNSLLYWEAFRRYGEYTVGSEKIKGLSVKQPRWFVAMPKEIGISWIEGENADLSFLEKMDLRGYGAISLMLREGGSFSRGDQQESLKTFFKYIEDTGLLAHAGNAKYGKTSALLKKVVNWAAWEKRWIETLRLPADEVREYTRWYFQHKFVVREMWFMDNALKEILNTDVHPPVFLLTPEEFDLAINAPGVKNDSILTFEARLKIFVREKTGYVRMDTKWTVEKEIERKLQEAPEYIRNSEVLSAAAKYWLWKLEPQKSWSDLHASEYTHIEEIAKTMIATGERKLKPIEGTFKGHADLDDLGWREMQVENQVSYAFWELLEELRIEQQFQNKSDGELAMDAALYLQLYDRDKENAQIARLVKVFSMLQRQELQSLCEHLKGYQLREKYMKAWKIKTASLKERLDTIRGEASSA
jgi:ParB/RepB/Spo0J family partition protein